MHAGLMLLVCDTFGKGSVLITVVILIVITVWPASHEKRPSDISHSVDQEHPLYDDENTYT